MIIFIWFICLIIIITLFGEIRFRQLRTRKKNREVFIAKEWSDNIDRDIDILDVETSTSSIVPTTTLAMRGSWRLAQDLVMDKSDFAELSEYEYNKVLH